YEQEVIVVPVLLLASFLVTIVFILLLRFCPEKVDRIRPKASKSPNRRVLHGIDRKLEAKQSFNLVNPLPTTFSLHSFLNFASFLAQLGPHPFLPELLGVVSLRAPLVTVMEELENRDLLSFLWRCREVPPMTERRIFTMAKQVASALEFLHSKGLLHGNVRARNVLVSRDFTAKLWGLHGVYSRKDQGAARRDDPSMKKWQAPEILAKRPAGPSSDIWSFGILLFEMVNKTVLLQFHQRGKPLKRPSNCSNALYSFIKSCCQFKDLDRPSMVEMGRKLLSGEKGASDKAIKASEKMSIEQYLLEAGYGETNSYTVF
uniref:Serine/threonine/tyrosine kinase 1b n=1 Tax=Takifugu rubripes TaxID=31033 RepID=A0A674MNM9_TAKRU